MARPRMLAKVYIQTATAPPTFAFDCYVVLDIEATCDNKKQMEPQEIIEFPLVLVDPKTSEQVDEFRPPFGTSYPEFLSNTHWNPARASW